MDINHRSRQFMGAFVISLFIVGTVQTSSGTDSFTEGVSWVAAIGDAIAVPINIFCSIGNTYNVIKGERISKADQIVCYSAGAFVSAVGIGIIALYGVEYDAFLWIGGGHLGLGALDIGMTIWASSQEEKKEKITLGPVIIPDAQGDPVLGIGLRLVNW